MPSSTENVKLGVCTILFDDVDLGYTKGGVEVTVATSTHEVKVDQLGETIVNEIVTGRTVLAKVPLAETTLENLVKIMPGATLVTDGDVPTKKKVVVKTGVNSSLKASAKTLVLRPVGTTGADDFTILAANTGGALTYAYKIDEERVFNVEFKGYANEDGELFVVGDVTAEA
jgi:hypothetical protein